jgi:hypothetical protein
LTTAQNDGGIDFALSEEINHPGTTRIFPLDRCLQMEGDEGELLNAKNKNKKNTGRGKAPNEEQDLCMTPIRQLI